MGAHNLLDFLDDEPQQEDHVRLPLPQNDNQGHENAVALAAYYERAAGDYQRDAAREMNAAASASVSSSTLPQTVAHTRAVHTLPNVQEGKLAIVPGTWVRSRKKGRSRGLVAFVLSTTKIYIAFPAATFANNPTSRRAPDASLRNYIAYPSPELLDEFHADPPLKKPTGNQIMCSKSGRPFKQKVFPSVIPTFDELELYANARHPRLLALECTTPSPALAEGDRVLVVAGEHKGFSGFIGVLGERRRVKYAKLVLAWIYSAEYDSLRLEEEKLEQQRWEEMRVRLKEDYARRKMTKSKKEIEKEMQTEMENERQKRKEKKTESIYVELVHLKRHGLDLFYRFRVHDRVCVVSGALYVGVIGHVAHIQGDILTIILPSDCVIVGPTTPSDSSNGRKTFQIHIGHVTRVWYPGDSVQVRRGEHKDRVGVIVALCMGGVLDLFDVSIFFTFLLD